MKKVAFISFLWLVVSLQAIAPSLPPTTSGELAQKNLGNLSSYPKLKELVTIASKQYATNPERPVIVKNIIRGAFVHSALIRSDAIFEEMLGLHKHYEANIRALMWFYFAHALAKGQSFSDGTFSIQDKTGEVFNYLRTCPGSYNRISTHFTHYLKKSSMSTEDKKQWGLNIAGLPADKKTLLFGKIDNAQGLFFIKPESEGVKHVAETLKHGGSLIAAQLRKIAPAVETKALVCYRGSDTPYITAFSHWLTGYVGTDDASTSRKERVPLNERLKFGKLLYAVNNSTIIHPKRISMSNALIAQHISKASVYGISYMHKQAQVLLGKHARNEKAARLIAGFIKELEEQYDYISLRFGREVILTDKELDILQDSI